MPEVIHVYSEQDSKGSLLAEVHRLQSSLAAMRQARDFHGANSAYLMQERDRLQKQARVLREALTNVVDGNDLAHSRQKTLESWPDSGFRRQAHAALAATEPRP